MGTSQETAILLCAVSTPGQVADSKDSIEGQERDLLALAEQENWHVADIIRIPGFSRNYYTWREFAEDANKAGINAPLRMFEHWQRGDFSVLACRDGSRFGRDTSIFNEVVNRTIDCGARLYTQEVGWIDGQNRRMYGMVGSFMAAVERDNIVKRTVAGRKALVQRGLPSNGQSGISHRVVRDERGKVVGVEVNTASQLLIRDAAQLVLEGIGWHNIGPELKRRFGHTNKGRIYHMNYWYRVFNGPIFWGHVASSPFSRKGGLQGRWAFDEGEPVPDHVELVRHTHEPALTGELAERVKAELRRRTEMHGNRRPNSTPAFAGLLYCNNCHTALYYRRKMGRYVCCSRDHHWRAVRCDRFHSVKETVIIEFLDPLLRHMLTTHAPDLLARLTMQADPHRQIDLLEAQLAAVETQIKRLIAKQASSPVSVADLYDGQITDLASQREQLQKRVSRARLSESADAVQAARAGFGRLQCYDDLTVFWAEPEQIVNQVLHHLMGRTRLLIGSGAVQGTLAVS